MAILGFKNFMLSLFYIAVEFIFNSILVNGHGRMMIPPSRNSMWRYGYPNPVNYNDNELYCGGYAVQWEQNGGRCGLCGDPYSDKKREHEAGGPYAKGIISRYYTAGEEIEVEIELTANHYGRFEMYLCPNNNHNREATESCFKRYPLVVSKTNDVRFMIPSDSKKQEIFRYKVKLPSFVTCSQCVLQWSYYTGNNWGICDNGTEGVGCGRPETFRNCADIAIVSNTAGVPPAFAGEFSPFSLYYKDYRSSSKITELIVRDQVCVPKLAYHRIPGIENWCKVNCLRYPPNCAETVCLCPRTCEAIGDIAGKEGADTYCLDKCLTNPSNCPQHRCRCY